MTSWNLTSSDHLIALSLELSGSETEVLSGTLTVEGLTYRVSGGWAASGSVAGRNYSAFAVRGNTGDIIQGAPNFVAAAGIMTGQAAAPTQIDLQVGVSSSSDGTLTRYSAVLVPSAPSVAKNQIVVLSDIHIGDNTKTVWYQRSVHEPYLLGIFDWIVANAANIRELVLAGDVVDFWTYPFGTRPPTFAMIAAQNPNIFGPKGLGRVLDALGGKVTYLPGNHDMAVTASEVASITSPGGHHVTLVDGPYFPLGADDHRIVITHGHDYTIFNAPDASSKWSPLPMGHFVTRMIATQTDKNLPPGMTVADLGGQGNPNSMDLLPIVNPVVAGLIGGIGSGVQQALRLFHDLPTALLNQIEAFSGTTDTDPITLADGTTTTLPEVRTVYANLVRRWSQQNDPQFAAKSTLADANGRYLGWFAQRLAFQVGAKLVVMGHTHTPISDLSGSMVHYVNSGFECPATPDMPSQSVSFTIIDATACTATVQRATLAGNTIGIEPCPAATAPVVEFGLPDFSCYVTIENDDAQDMALSSSSIGHGHFVVPPPTTIKAHSTATIWLQDDPGLHGSDATVTFTTSAGNQRFAFDCPTGVFSNACSGGTSFITKAGDGPWSGPGQVVTQRHPFYVQFRFSPAPIKVKARRGGYTSKDVHHGQDIPDDSESQVEPSEIAPTLTVSMALLVMSRINDRRASERLVPQRVAS